MPSTTSQATTIRISNEVFEILQRDWKKKGYTSMRSYARAILEEHAQGFAGLISNAAQNELEKRAKEKGYPTLRDYLSALLESYALGPQRPVRVPQIKAVPKKAKAR